MLQFTHPIYLLLIIPAGVLTCVALKRSLADLSGARRSIALAIRCMLFLLIVLAVAGAQFVRTNRNLAVVFVLDISDSIPREKIEAGLAYIRDAIQNMKPSDYAGLVVFGADASVELAPLIGRELEYGAINRAIGTIRSIPSTNYTDIAQALNLAMASFPQGTSKRIVLLSDGNENLGKALDQAYLAQSNGITIDSVALSAGIGWEVMLERLTAPAEVKLGEPFDLKLLAVSEEETVAAVRLMRNRRSVDEKMVHLSRGKNMLTFTQSITRAGSYTYEAIIDADADTRSENNRALAAVTVRGRPKVLCVEGRTGEGQHLERALEAQHIDVERCGPGGIPNQMAEFADCDALIMSDVPATLMSPEQMKMIQCAVRDLGIGFGMIGGEDSFGAGGYSGTPIEEILPVDMSIRKQHVYPSMTVYIIIDKSGSMGAEENGVEKIRLAAEAAIAVTETLRDDDLIGIIATDSDPKTISPIRPARMKREIAENVSSLRAGGGGILCFSSLKRAEEDLADVRTRIRHIIMLADGSDSEEQEGCFEIARKMFRDGITISTVAIGGGPDVPFLQRIAKFGGGGFYLTERASDLPRIFTRDALLASKSLIVEEPFKPIPVTSHFAAQQDGGMPEVLQGIDWENEPPLLGYVTTSPKKVAETLLKSHKNDPIYAQRRYGLGRSIAFTSDAKAKWAARWVGWSGYARFWSQVVRWSMRKSSKADLQVDLDVSGGVGKVTVDAVTEKGEFINYLELSAMIVTPKIRSLRLKLSQTAPGRYETEFPARDVGTYVVNVIRKLPGGQVSSQMATIAMAYPPEYKDIRPNNFLLNQIARISSGLINPQPAQVFRRSARAAKIPADLWQLLVFISAFLLPLDIAVRRINVTWSDAVAAFSTIASRVRATRPAYPKPIPEIPSLVRLKSSRRIRKQNEQAERIEISSTSGSIDMKSESTVSAYQEKSGDHPAEESAGSAGDREQDESPTGRLLAAKKRARGGR